MHVDPFDEAEHGDVNDENEGRRESEVQHAGDQGVDQENHAIFGVLRTDAAEELAVELRLIAVVGDVPRHETVFEHEKEIAVGHGEDQQEQDEKNDVRFDRVELPKDVQKANEREARDQPGG